MPARMLTRSETTKWYVEFTFAASATSDIQTFGQAKFALFFVPGDWPAGDTLEVRPVLWTSGDEPDPADAVPINDGKGVTGLFQLTTVNDEASSATGVDEQLMVAPIGNCVVIAPGVYTGTLRVELTH